MSLQFHPEKVYCFPSQLTLWPKWPVKVQVRSPESAKKDAELGQKVLEVQEIVPRASRRSGQCKGLGVPITSGDDLNVGAMQGAGAFAPLPM